MHSVRMLFSWLHLQHTTIIPYMNLSPLSYGRIHTQSHAWPSAKSYMYFPHHLLCSIFIHYWLITGPHNCYAWVSLSSKELNNRQQHRLKKVHCIISNCCQCRINAWSRLVAGVAVYVSVIDAGSWINVGCGGVAHMTCGDPRTVVHCSWSGKMSKRNASYNIGFILRVVKCAKGKSKEADAREFRVDAQRIHEWCQQKERLTALKKHGRLGESGWKAWDVKQTMTISK